VEVNATTKEEYLPNDEVSLMACVFVLNTRMKMETKQRVCYAVKEYIGSKQIRVAT
jgi:hypothetical protein